VKLHIAAAPPRLKGEKDHRDHSRSTQKHRSEQKYVGHTCGDVKDYRSGLTRSYRPSVPEARQPFSGQRMLALYSLPEALLTPGPNHCVPGHGGCNASQQGQAVRVTYHVHRVAPSSSVTSWSGVRCLAVRWGTFVT